ncbi:5-oxoprolinase [Pseudozyma hubeiensis]|nr:5-oxoprolinase [Pseudozyma hubeiensis]
MSDGNRIQIAIDRGGTFTDCLGRIPPSSPDQEPTDIVIKLLSHDPANYKDAPTEGVRRILEQAYKTDIPRGQKIDTSNIDYIRLSTTVATNALLERKGERHALVITKGFKDLVQIGNQSRPSIFDLAIKKPEVLYEGVLEVDERVTLVGYTSDPRARENAVQFDLDSKQEGDYITKINETYKGTDQPPKAYDAEGKPTGQAEIVRGISGEAVAILKKPDQELLKKQLHALYHEHGYRSLAVVLMHSYTYPLHEQIIKKIALDVGFDTVSCSSQLMPMIKMVPRATSSTADAYLTPVLQAYIDGFFSGFEDSLRSGEAGTKVEFMMSDGGLTSVDHFSGLKSIISGPAGGVVGMALTSYDKEDKRPIIGFDMGGTSTDVSRYDGQYEQVFETTLDGITIQSPQLDVNTVASGGSSRLFFRNGLFTVGPESASAHPGPTCYRKGGPLAITDANLVTGRLAVEMFPKIFGPDENQGLDEEASQRAFEELTEEINSSSERKLSVDQVAQGFIRVANEIMCRPIRALTEARGYSASKHILASFGGAGGQHACSLARSLGIKTVIVHKYSSILSAYGMALADRVFEEQEPCSETWEGEGSGSQKRISKRVDELRSKVSNELEAQGFKGDRIQLQTLLNLRYEGTDTALMTLQPENGGWDFERVFVDKYKQEFGFVLEDKNIIVDDIRVKGIGKSFDSLGQTVLEEFRQLFTDKKAVNTDGADKVDPLAVRKVYFDEEGRLDTPIIKLDKLEKGTTINGPAILVDQTQTILLEPHCRAHLTSQAVLIDILYD